MFEEFVSSLDANTEFEFDLSMAALSMFIDYIYYRIESGTYSCFIRTDLSRLPDVSPMDGSVFMSVPSLTSPYRLNSIVSWRVGEFERCDS